jgi:hypothetical protein
MVVDIELLADPVTFFLLTLSLPLYCVSLVNEITSSHGNEFERYIHY